MCHWVGLALCLDFGGGDEGKGQATVILKIEILVERHSIWVRFYQSVDDVGVGWKGQEVEVMLQKCWRASLNEIAVAHLSVLFSLSPQSGLFLCIHGDLPHSLVQRATTLLSFKIRVGY